MREPWVPTGNDSEPDPFWLSIWMTLWKFFIWPRDGCWMWWLVYCFPWFLGARLGTLILWGWNDFCFRVLFVHTYPGVSYSFMEYGESLGGLSHWVHFSNLSQIYYIIWQMPNCSIGLEYLFVPWATWKNTGIGIQKVTTNMNWSNISCLDCFAIILWKVPKKEWSFCIWSTQSVL